jgi:beta-phosphoglucomutase family hydrolase
LPISITACLFDLDGVLTSTAELHAWAWKETFDAFLACWALHVGATDFVPFDRSADYRRFVDGKLRDEGVRSFLASRDISLPEGKSSDGLRTWTVRGLSNAKNALFVEAIAKAGVDVYPGSLRFLRAARGAGMQTAVVSASANTKAVLKAASLSDRFDVVVDGNEAAHRHLAGKPEPDTYLAAASDLGTPPARAAVFEDALSGVAAGHAGGFGLVVGVDRGDNGDELRAHGADLVVSDLAELVEER